MLVKNHEPTGLLLMTPTSLMSLGEQTALVNSEQSSAAETGCQVKQERTTYGKNRGA